MSTRSWQAWRCGELLGAASGTEVRLTWSGRPGAGAWSGWVVQWHDGPTEEQMRQTAADLLGPVEGPRADELSYGRCLSAEGEAIALLLWLQGHPRALRSVGAVHLVAARDEVAYPERADADTRARAAELLARGRGSLGYEVLRELAGHARCGWAGVTAWLDGPMTPVVDLAAERARRRGMPSRRRRS
ncbi:MAG: hypothetical protein AB7J32_09840 [Pseudonocardia sp.]